MMIIKSPAKINLFLEITGKHENLHKLHSLFIRIDLHDEITVKPHIKPKTDYMGVNIENDIIQKTVSVLQTYFPRINADFEFTISKKIPIGSGLGGASSNAASVIKFLLKENNISLPQEQMFEIAAKIGSDVPFFLSDGNMILNGTGMELSKPEFEIPPLYFALLYPNYVSITKDVFAQIKPPYTDFKPVTSFKDCIARKNDMEFHTDILSSGIISRTLKALQKPEALKVQMSGSGSACFAVFEDAQYAQYENPQIITAKSL